MSWSSIFLASLAAIASAQEDVGASALASAERSGGSLLHELYSLRLQSSIKESALKKKAKELEKAAYSTPDRNRVFGSQGHENTLQFIEGYFKLATEYWSFERQPFTALYAQGSGTFSAGGTPYDLGVFTYSASTTAEGVTAPIVAVANLGCDAADYPAEVTESIALISRGTCPFAQKSALAEAAGAVGAIIHNNIEGNIAGTLGGAGDYAPTGGISLSSGTAIREALPLNGSLQITSVVENRTTFNIVADSKSGDKNNVVVIGAHSDSVEAGPGINDDGSGTIGILVTAMQLSKYNYRLKNALRVCFWSAEEFGLLGSKFYVASLSEEELDKIRLYLNFDMIASPNWEYALYDGDGSEFNLTGPPGSDHIEHFFQDYFQSKHIATKPTEFDGRSDYGPFIAEGVNIPAGGIFTGAEQLKTEEDVALWGGEAGVAYDINYHAAGDNYTNLAFEPFLANTKAIAASVVKYTMDLSGIPCRNSTGAVKRRRGDELHSHAKKNTVPSHAHQPGLKCGSEPKVEI